MFVDKIIPGRVIEKKGYLVLKARNSTATATFELKTRQIRLEPAFDVEAFDLYRYVLGRWVKQTMAIDSNVGAMFALKWLWPLIQQTRTLVLKPYLQAEAEGIDTRTALSAVAYHIFSGNYLKALKILLFEDPFNPYKNYSLHAIGYDYVDLASYLFRNFGNPSEMQVIVRKAEEYKQKNDLPNAQILWHNYTVLRSLIKEQISNPFHYWEQRRIKSKVIYSEQNLYNRIKNGLNWIQDHDDGIYYPIVNLPIVSLAYLSEPRAYSSGSRSYRFLPITQVVVDLTSAATINSMARRLYGAVSHILGQLVFFPSIVLSQFQKNWTAPFLPFGPSSFLTFLVVKESCTKLGAYDINELIQYLKKHEGESVIPFYLEANRWLRS